MKLDNEQQRKLLLQIVNSTPINGNFTQAKEAVKLIDELTDAIQKAEIVVSL